MSILMFNDNVDRKEIKMKKVKTYMMKKIVLVNNETFICHCMDNE